MLEFIIITAILIANWYIALNIADDKTACIRGSTKHLGITIRVFFIVTLLELVSGVIIV